MSADTLKSAVNHRTWLGISASVAGAATIASGVWQALPSTPGGVVSWVPILGLILTITLTAAWYLKNQAVIAGVHAEIMHGNTHNPKGSTVERAIARRIKTLETPRARRQLATDLRTIAHQAQQPDNPNKAGTIDLFTASERHVLTENHELINHLAETVEHTTVDPRALIILRRVAAGYPAASPNDPTAGTRLTQNLTNAQQLITETRPTPNPSTVSGNNAGKHGMG